MPEGFEQARALVATKAKACAACILDNDARADMVEAHAKAFWIASKPPASVRSGCANTCKATLAACGIQSIKSDDGTFTAVLQIGRDESVEVFDAAMLPADYMREIPAKQGRQAADQRKH